MNLFSSILTLQHISCTFEKLELFFLRKRFVLKLENSTAKCGIMAHGYNSRLGKLGQECREFEAVGST